MKSDRNWVYFITRIIVTIYFTLYHRLSVYGKEKIPRDRPVIIASNHASYLDPPVVGYAFFPGYLKFIAWDKLFSFRPFGAFLRAMGSVPVSQQDKNSSAALLRLVMGFIKEGFNVFICPEGHRTEDGRLQPLEGGVAIMALKTGAPVVPPHPARPPNLFNLYFFFFIFYSPFFFIHLYFNISNSPQPATTNERLRTLFSLLGIRVATSCPFFHKIQFLPATIFFPEILK